MLGVLCHEQADHARAIELMGRLPTSRTTRLFMRIWRKRIGRSVNTSGPPAAAAGHHLRPDYPEALANLGLALHRDGPARRSRCRVRKCGLRLRPTRRRPH